MRQLVRKIELHASIHPPVHSGFGPEQLEYTRYQLYHALKVASEKHPNAIEIKCVVTVSIFFRRYEVRGNYDQWDSKIEGVAQATVTVSTAQAQKSVQMRRCLFLY